MRGRRSHSLLGAALVATAIAWTKPERTFSQDSTNLGPGGVKGTAPNPARKNKAQKKAEKRSRRTNPPPQ